VLREDCRKAINFVRQMKMRVLGVVENMSGFECPQCQAVFNLFGKGGGESLAREMGVPFLGSLPLDPRVRIGGDTGRPVALLGPDDAKASGFYEIAQRVVERCGAGGIRRAPKMTIED